MTDLSLFLPEKLLPWYEQNKRDLPWRQTRDPYRVWVSEIMLQQTRVEAVLGYYRRFLSALPDIQALAAVEDDVLLKLWEGLGYYNRARNLKKAAQVIVSEHGGVFPKDYDAIRTLPGIGPYTAGAIGSICFGLPTPAVDGNVLRVFARLTALEDSIDKDQTKKSVTAALEQVYQTGHCAALTQSLMELGACVCLPNGAPKCALCPLQDDCLAYRNKNWTKFPVRSEKKGRRIEHRAVPVLRCGDRYAIRQRPKTGLLAGLWEFPGELLSPETTDEFALQTALKFAETAGAKPRELLQETGYIHIFTHIEWHMHVFLFECAAMPDCFTWATKDELERTFALPSAFRPCVEKLTAIDESLTTL